MANGVSQAVRSASAEVSSSTVAVGIFCFFEARFRRV